MTEKINTNPQENPGRDITAEFIADQSFSFYEFLRTVRTEPLLEINLDLRNVASEDQFVNLARRAKAFLEGKKLPGQKREASIRCTEEQKKWEYNVFASGVRWEKAEDG